ncbi:hypothetical protein HYPSUDRAFT_44264 [Hypholoma sublateritium FD-334 SS-4]|uniref:Uncharacterized protein n=1 Tax=Hypholoma sublateritium (strain FD-334 SS-4) TaxID=945553 RepID=A0A0D2NS48_HYPSF|nr:hypothetical protein HYPSUDRAFT_44264 [Hypholoma sublateritium FD-334 SS-4]
MAYQQSVPYAQQQQLHTQPMGIQTQDIVSGDQYRYALTNFRIAHEKVEQQRLQLEEQERQVAQLRGRIALLEGGVNPSIGGPNGNTIDDFSIKNSASQLDKLINRWAADVIRAPPVPLQDLCAAILNDVVNGLDVSQVEIPEATSIQVQSYLRHAMAETISEGIINCLIVTNSTEANIQLTRIHEHIFARDPTVASVWRRQTFSAAVESCTPDMSLTILHEQVPELMNALNGKIPASGGVSILESAYAFSRMLHGSGSPSSDAFYRAFVPELGSVLYPRQIELVKRCLKSERGETDRVGATIFPGLVKVTRGGTPGAPETAQTVVRRAQVICECAMGGSSIFAMPAYDPQQVSMQQGNMQQAALPTLMQSNIPQPMPHMSHSLTPPTMTTAMPIMNAGMQYQQQGYF